jgi:hypothetical protein
MKTLNSCIAAVLLVGCCAAPVTTLAADKKAAKPKPYPLQTCVVSDEKLGEMGDAYVFVHEGREIKLCCKSCLSRGTSSALPIPPLKRLSALVGAFEASWRAGEADLSAPEARFVGRPAGRYRGFRRAGLPPGRRGWIMGGS